MSRHNMLGLVWIDGWFGLACSHIETIVRMTVVRSTFDSDSGVLPVCITTSPQHHICPKNICQLLWNYRDSAHFCESP